MRPKERYNLFCLFSFVSFVYFFFKVFSSSTARFSINPAIYLLPIGQCETFNETNSRHRLMERKLLLEVQTDPFTQAHAYTKQKITHSAV